MYSSLCFQLSLISLIFFTAIHCTVTKDAIEESLEALPPDFRDFLKGISLMSQRHEEADTTTTTTVSTLATVRPEVLLSSQKAVLRDMLMMKLVSYYEDKYRVSHHVTTGGPETLEPLQAEAQIHTKRNNVRYDKPSSHSISHSYDDGTLEKYQSEGIAGVVVI